MKILTRKQASVNFNRVIRLAWMKFIVLKIYFLRHYLQMRPLILFISLIHILTSTLSLHISYIIIIKSTLLHCLVFVR